MASYQIRRGDIDPAESKSEVKTEFHIFSNFHISKEDLSKISELSKKNTLIFVPNHQSNFDFPTIFYLLYKRCTSETTSFFGSLDAVLDQN